MANAATTETALGSDWEEFEASATPPHPFVVHVSGAASTPWETRSGYPMWVTDVEKQLRRLWTARHVDDPRADALSRVAVRSALEILDDVASPDTLPPALVPTPTGGLQIEWHHPDVDIEIYIDARGLISSWVREGIREWESDRYSPARLSKELSRVTYQVADVE